MVTNYESEGIHMDSARLYDITEVCRKLATTSRTLRFYEEKGIIASTRSLFSARRRYTEEQVEHIRYVLILRTLGLSVRAISDLQHKGVDLRQAILAKRAEIYAAVESLSRELRILNEALSIVEAGGAVGLVDTARDMTAYTGEYARLLQECTAAIICGDTARLYRHLAPSLVAVLPLVSFDKTRIEALEPLGKFVSYGDLMVADDPPSAFIHYVRYEKLGLKITYVLTDGKIDGLWLGYYET
jgi:DNA-binding transcriptional MerR regulator